MSRQIISELLEKYRLLKKAPRGQCLTPAEAEGAEAAARVNEVFKASLRDYFSKRYPHG